VCGLAGDILETVLHRQYAPPRTSVLPGTHSFGVLDAHSEAASPIRGSLAHRSHRPAPRELTLARTSTRLVLIQGGDFAMGSCRGHFSEQPVHRVKLSAFWLGRYPVTNAEYSRFLDAYPDHPRPKFWHHAAFSEPAQPVVGISWDDAQAFCQWLGGALPTEAQWEYACRAGTDTHYWSGEDESDLALVSWYRGNSGHRLHSVGEKQCNSWGLYDMHGNVWEWCQDTFLPYDGNEQHNPCVLSDGLEKVLRGGFWNTEPIRARSCYRGRLPRRTRGFDSGFRIMLPFRER